MRSVEIVTWRPDFSLPGVPPLDQAGDDGGVAEGAFHQAALGQPGVKIVAEHVDLEKLRSESLSSAMKAGNVLAHPHT